MKNKEDIPNIPVPQVKSENLPGYPVYPTSEDVYSKMKEETEIDPEDPSKFKVKNEIPDITNETNFENDLSGSDLDIPGSEMDDVQENIGSEDEENNYYSLGGDNHDEA